MPAPELTMPEYVSLKNHPDISEKWLQERLIEKPELLGLGDGLVARDFERAQPSGGRLDLLLEDSDGDINKWYEVEIQLGSVDESHIIRTIEYWDIEKRRYPQYDHTAVIVAENITGRFLNVISLFNRSVPLIAIQLRGVKINGAFTLVATRVLDVVQLGMLEGPRDITGSQDRAYWEQRSSADSLNLVDELFRIVNEIAPGGSLRFTKSHIGLEYDGRARNFVIFHPRRRFGVVAMQFKLPREYDTDKLINDAGLETLSYDVSFGLYQVRIQQDDIEDEQRRKALSDLIEKARDAY